MIYIAGKIGGLPYSEAETKFAQIANHFRRNNLTVINPMELGMKNWNYEEQIQKCLQMIEIHATAIYMLGDWQQSKGAKTELAFVGKINLNRKNGDRIDIYYERENGAIETIAGVKFRNLSKSFITLED
jgi:hypothetical protein